MNRDHALTGQMPECLKAHHRVKDLEAELKKQRSECMSIVQYKEYPFLLSSEVCHPYLLSNGPLFCYMQNEKHLTVHNPCRIRG